jgi:hypothetical protein
LLSCSNLRDFASNSAVAGARQTAWGPSTAPARRRCGGGDGIRHQRAKTTCQIDRPNYWTKPMGQTIERGSRSTGPRLDLWHQYPWHRDGQQPLLVYPQETCRFTETCEARLNGGGEPALSAPWCGLGAPFERPRWACVARCHGCDQVDAQSGTCTRHTSWPIRGSAGPILCEQDRKDLPTRPVGGCAKARAAGTGSQGFCVAAML